MASNTNTSRAARISRNRYKGVCVRPDLRLAIYLRDGLACAWCGHGVEGGADLSLDHLVPQSEGGANEPANLVTACRRCNCSRQDRTPAEFARDVATYLGSGVTGGEILRHVRRTAKRAIAAHRAEAKEMIARRGTAARVLADISG